MCGGGCDLVLMMVVEGDARRWALPGTRLYSKNLSSSPVYSDVPPDFVFVDIVEQ